MFGQTTIYSEEEKADDIINDLDLHIKIRLMQKQMVGLGLLEEAGTS